MHHEVSASPALGGYLVVVFQGYLVDVTD